MRVADDTESGLVPGMLKEIARSEVDDDDDRHRDGRGHDDLEGAIPLVTDTRALPALSVHGVSRCGVLAAAVDSALLLFPYPCTERTTLYMSFHGHCGKVCAWLVFGWCLAGCGWCLVLSAARKRAAA